MRGCVGGASSVGDKVKIETGSGQWAKVSCSAIMQTVWRLISQNGEDRRGYRVPL